MVGLASTARKDDAHVNANDADANAIATVEEEKANFVKKSIFGKKDGAHR
jgi:hypothetical protein